MQVFQNILHRLHQLGAVAQQLVRAAALHTVHAAGHGEDFAPLLGGMGGGDQRAAALGRFHDHDTE